MMVLAIAALLVGPAVVLLAWAHGLSQELK